jgi:hypothetical protein
MPKAESPSTQPAVQAAPYNRPTSGSFLRIGGFRETHADMAAICQANHNAHLKTKKLAPGQAMEAGHGIWRMEPRAKEKNKGDRVFELCDAVLPPTEADGDATIYSKNFLLLKVIRHNVSRV